MKTHQAVVEGWMTRPWQQEIVEHPARKKVVRVSRRAGKTALSIVKCLHKSFVEGKGVLVVAPLERQVAEIYQTMHKQFMDPHPEIFAGSIKQDVKSPYKIVWNNGGFINFVTAGTKSGGKGDAVRGQGHGVGLVYIDECDYMTDADIESILALPAQDPTMEVIMTSTPTGKRNFFYRQCTNPPEGWVAFHKTCWEAIPTWNDTIDLEMRETYSPEGYAREFLAEFGEEVTGVFNKETIDAACERGNDSAEYPYPSITTGRLISVQYPTYGYADGLQRNPNTFRIVGVDWDKYGAGTQILIIEAERAQPSNADEYEKALEQPFSYIKVVHRSEIEKSKFTLNEAVKKLVAINQSFAPDFYYLDAGYGEHQIETLQVMGMEAKDPASPAWKLHEKIVRVNFSQGVVVLDPISKREEKRRIKPEMVGRLRNKFDQGEIILNPHDKILKKQLLDYVVEKITASGEPKYTSVNEHAVDALMLAVWGLYEQFGKKLLKEFQRAFIEKPLGERYSQFQKAAEEAKRANVRRDYFAEHKPDPQVDRDNIEEDLMLARQGLIRADQIVSTPGVPGSSALARNDSNSYFVRGASRHVSRRRF